MFHPKDGRDDLDVSPAATPSFAQLVGERYGPDQAPAAGLGNDVLRAMLDHRSIRSYRDETVPDEVVAAMVAAAQSASSSSNLQLWTAITVTDTERKSRLSKLAGDQAHIDAAPLLIVWLADLSRARRIAASEALPADGLDFLESFLTAAIDASLAAQNATLAAESLGYGTCYIGGMRNHPVKVAAELGLPPETFAVFGLTVGRPVADSTAQIKPRLPQSSVLKRERYDAEGEAKELSAYNGTLSVFQEAQGMRVSEWTQTVAKRLAGPQSLSNRDKLKAYLRDLGFKLS